MGQRPYTTLLFHVTPFSTMTPKSGTASAAPRACEPPNRNRNSFSHLLGRKKKERPTPPKTTAITEPPVPNSPPPLPVVGSELDLSVAELRSACDELEQIMASCRGALDPKLWEQSVLISPSTLENADSLCQWLALAASKSDPTVPTRQPQTLRRQILGGMSHAIKATAHIITPTLKTVLPVGTQLSAVAPYS